MPTHENQTERATQLRSDSTLSSSTSAHAVAPPAFQLQASAPIQRTEGDNETENTLTITPGKLTSSGEGSDAQTSHIHWPETDASGVTLGKGYDIGSRTEQQVIDELTAAGMGEEQAKKIAKGHGKKGQDAGDFVTANKDDVGEIDIDVQYKLLATMLEEYTGKAKDLATSTTATTDGSGYYTNARGREVNDGVDAGTYVLSEAQWDALHPAMIEFLTDLKYQGGYYLYDRIAKVNKALIDNDGDHLEQFKAVAELFESDTEDELSYMDRYGKKIGEGTGSTETFYEQSSEDLEGASTRRNRLRLAYLKHIISALESGQTVVLGDGESSSETTTETTTTNDNNNETTTPEVTTTPDLGNDAATAAAESASNTGGTEYVVQPGEGLLALAKKHGVTVEALKTANADKLKKWGSVEGFNAGETITIPGSTGGSTNTPTTTTVSEDTSTEEPSLDLNSIAQSVYNAMFATFYGTGWGTDEEAVYTALAQLQNDQGQIDQLLSTYKTKFGRDLEADIRSEFNDYFSGDHSQKALGYLNITGGKSSTPKKPVQEEEEEASTGSTTDYRTEAITSSVGKGGTNNAKDVKIIQQNLVHLGFLANGPEVTTVAGMEDSATVQEAQLTATIAAINLFQKRGLGGGSDGRVDAGGGTFGAMEARLEEMTELSSHEIKTEGIDPVMQNSEWISQFKNGANTKKNGTVVNMTITGEGRGLLDSEKAYATKSNYVCCWDAAMAMVKSKGGEVSGDKASFLQSMVQDGGEDHVLGDQAQMGVKYIDKALLSGKPVFIAVDDGRTASYNYDGTTEHYIVIMGKVIKDNKIYYRFFDPGSAHGATKGYNENNLLYVGEDYTLTGSKPGSSRTYTMSHLRQNT